MPSSSPGHRPSSIARLGIALSLPVALAIYAVAFYGSVDDLGLTSRAYPQAIIAFVLLALVSQVWTDVRDWLRAGDRRGLTDTWRRWRRTALTAAWTAAFVWGIQVIGFYEALALYVLVLLPLLGIRRPLIVAAFTAGTIVGIYLVFDLALKVRLPPGLLVG